MEDRIDELEQRYMHQEKTIQELNEIVSRQDLAIEFLKREISVIKEQSLLLAPSLVKDADQETPPPHY
jgi:SlyX protein